MTNPSAKSGFGLNLSLKRLVFLSGKQQKTNSVLPWTQWSFEMWTFFLENGPLTVLRIVEDVICSNVKTRNLISAGSLAANFS